MSHDNGGFKWLRVKNWRKYQPDARLRNKEARLKYILDHTDKLDNYDFQQLSIFERGVFEHVCLVIGTRPSRSIPNDPTWIARAIHASRSESPRVHHALTTLQQHGYIIPTNTEKFFEDENEFAVGEGEGLRTETRNGDGTGEGFKAGSKLGSEEPLTSFEPLQNGNEDKNQSLTPEDLKARFESEDKTVQTLFASLYPSGWGPKLWAKELPIARQCASLLAENKTDPAALLKFNATHKKGGLVFRSCAQLLKALSTDEQRVLNEYMSHDTASCLVCKKIAKEASS